MIEEFTPEIRERGRSVDGQVMFSDERLFFQFFAFGGCHDVQPLVKALAGSGLDGALYCDANDPTGVGLACVALDPEHFVTQLHPFLRQSVFADLVPKPEFTMLGRAYSIGYEQDLDHTLIRRPHQRLVNPKLPWVIWYPLRRNGAFQELDKKAQLKILGEHGTIGRAFGEAGLAQDIRLACFGLDKQDNDFIIGLLGDQLQPLSAVVEVMRKTQQTSKYIEKLGPFFVGKVVWQSAPRALSADASDVSSS